MKKFIFAFLFLLCAAPGFAQYITGYPVSDKTFKDLLKISADWEALNQNLAKDNVEPRLAQNARQNLIVVGAISNMLTIEYAHLDKGQMSTKAISQIKNYVTKFPVYFESQIHDGKAQVEDPKNPKALAYGVKFSQYIARTLKILSAIDADLNQNIE